MTGTLIWDFDGTLGRLEGSWTACLIDTLELHEAGHVVDREQLRALLEPQFPWHEADMAHPQLCDPESWWRHVEALMTGVYETVGFPGARAAELAEIAHQTYLDQSSNRWSLFDDTLPGLDELSGDGWRHIILSNHVPELPDIVASLGLGEHISETFVSATIGYEKPHPAAFAIAVDSCPQGEPVWMIGYNPQADVRGAEAAGIPAILIRTDHPAVARRAANMEEVAAIVGRAP